MGPRELPLFHIWVLYPLLVHNLECCCQSQQKRQAFRPSHAQSPAPIMNTQVRISTAQILSFPCMEESGWWFPGLCSVLEPISTWSSLVLTPRPWPWKTPCCYSVKRLLWCWPRCWLCGRQNIKSSCKCKGMEQNILFWLNDSITCYLGRAIITMLPHILCWPPQLGLGMESGE